ncbi:preprotein translocase subunit SecE [Catenisphaera adipataccumulans]|jgi:preprotein translocase subunit SecE|uniref:Protein translocase subunit SecE n=1 Tax=Catenisphaera adipataccumulans TaxID=700500 RepID=A0A7W8CXW9_9FIRM|nr:preprotein translocase subunit SecE [Catenisphaera adipataccumulans]MBB5183645.1 preprotein translocase SecE subunit [Catenisphaera adipataccumulans]
MASREEKKQQKKLDKEAKARAKAEEKEAKAKEKAENKAALAQLKADNKAFKAHLKTLPRKERKAAKREHEDEYLKAEDKLTKRVYQIRQVRGELRRVQWPSFGQLMKSSSLVIVFTILFGLYFFLCELLANGMLKAILG